ncbi:MAG: carbamoyltransferase C-terminal domain-containing protein [Xenococcaceae cyanobacterium MO_167.B52]|nr:carbamoyltransferase C-terminal domain-containing protein [Xenococcaceae cyanobacterium MO_167.B52]
MITLGINSVYHESAAALLIDGQVLAASEEERFNRRKHAKSAEPQNPHILPLKAIAFCLNRANLTPQNLDKIAFSFEPKIREKYFQVDPISVPGGWGSQEGEDKFRYYLQQVPVSIVNALGEGAEEKIVYVPHHLAHAASSFFPSGFAEAAFLTIDGIAENASAMLGIANGNKLIPKYELQYPHSLGFLWEKLAKYLGFSEYDACKVMGLAAYGKSLEWQEAFQKIAWVREKGFAVDPKVACFRLPNFEGLDAILGSHRSQGDSLEERHYNIAATLQEFNNKAVLSLVEYLYSLYPSNNLCLAGGVTLNCVTNWLVKEQGPYQNIYIPPAANDAGTAVGAALYVDRSTRKPETNVPQLNPYLGPDFTDEEILEAIAESGLRARYSADIAVEAADLIAGKKVVGWFQRRMEFGPRALGNRSLLADPRHASTRKLLNLKVKHRENFRPFGPSVLLEKAKDWFEIGRPSESLKYMLFACPVRPEKQDKIPAVVHVDGTSRIQLVDRTTNPKYYRLIEQFEKNTGVPLVLNTSFNDSEPIVCSPQDAISTFNRTNIDALILGDFIIERKN